MPMSEIPRIRQATQCAWLWDGYLAAGFGDADLFPAMEAIDSVSNLTESWETRKMGG